MNQYAFECAKARMKKKHPKASEAQVLAWAKSSASKTVFNEHTEASKYDIQRDTEEYYNKNTVRTHVIDEMAGEIELVECMETAIEDITDWAKDTHGYLSKNRRLATFREFNDIADVVFDIMVVVYQLDDKPELLTSVVGQCAGAIRGFDEHRDAVITCGEIITLMCDADLFDLEKHKVLVEDQDTGEEFHTDSYMIHSPWAISEELAKHILRAMYLPPMIVPPRILKHNQSTGYLTKSPESLILGHGNHHNGNICLDSLNRFNQIPLSLNQEMLTEVGEIIDDKTKQKMLEDPKRKEQYEKMLKESYHVYAYLIKNGNKFWLEHKPDKRGRTYAQGHHCSTQGNSFRKAVVELYNKEQVNGTF